VAVAKESKLEPGRFWYARILKSAMCGPGHCPRAIDSGATPTVWDGVVRPKHFVLGCVIDPLVAMEERMKAPGRTGAGAVCDDRREVFGLA
jgi:hypothetical protein